MPGGQDPRLLKVPLSPSEGVDGVRESAAFLASEGLSRALLEKEGRQEAAQAAEKIWDVEMLEEEDEGEVEEEEEEEEFDFEFRDQEVDEYQSPDFEYGFGNEEESESEEGKANEEENEEEEEVIEQEEGNSQGQEHAEIAAGPPEDPMTRFWSLLRVLINSLLHRIYDKDHVLIRPHACCLRDHLPLPGGPGPWRGTVASRCGRARKSPGSGAPERGSRSLGGRIPGRGHPTLRATGTNRGPCIPKGRGTCSRGPGRCL